MKKVQEFIYRRKKVINYMLPNSIALFFSTVENEKTNKYKFYQNSNFWYLTGSNEPKSLLILLKKERNYTILFNLPSDRNTKIWSGQRLGQCAALEKVGVDFALPWNQLKKELPKLLSNVETIYYIWGLCDTTDSIVFKAIKKLRINHTQKIPTVLIDCQPLIHEMRLLKSPSELNFLRKSGYISSLAQNRAMTICKPGMFEYQLESEILYEFARNNAYPPSYSTIVGSGNNGCILHYTDNNSILKNNQLVLVDAGCKYCGYASDVTRTFPINGKFTVAQKEIYNIVLTAMNNALSLCVPGTKISSINKEIIFSITKGLIDLGLLKGQIEKLVTKKSYQRFFMHSSFHWLGIDVHDVGHYGLNSNRKLEPRMVISIEPGVYIAPDSDISECYHNIGIRIEDNLIITNTGHENITELAVKSIEDIESMMASK